MFTPITSAAASAYDRARVTIAPQPGHSAAAVTPATGPLTSGDRFMQALEAVDSTATGALKGSVAVPQLVQTVAEAELALETVVAIRDKVVEAYQEILRMPV
ncbi:flagellar hook-basal body protein FliE [Paracoccus suum]|uniref:Flagellar hook-basal body protein FliE n=1 Tax=Paracoccus suum TaxID=2259340 RepID=A0A344PNN8_9RHOB|nr:flagellar hook-basal body complex protein FliE [Paracoccus suum]AXC50993.1 flagellar hook-basal body protein FliE [Paracoccus suum]